MRRSYQFGSLVRQDLVADPVEQFRKWFDEIKTLETPEWFEPNAMTVSTSTGDSISSRILLLKEFSSSGFVFFTSYDSKKSRQLAINSQVSLNFYWAPMDRQVRIEGSASKTSRDNSIDYFFSRPIESQMGAIVSTQSGEIGADVDLEAARRTFADKVQSGEIQLQCPANWGGWNVRPNLFEFWQGRPSRLHDRFEYVLDGATNEWRIRRLGP